MLSAFWLVCIVLSLTTHSDDAYQMDHTRPTYQYYCLPLTNHTDLFCTRQQITSACNFLLV